MQLVAVDVGNSSIKYITGNLDSVRDTADSPDCCSLSLHELGHTDVAKRLHFDQPAHWFVSSVNAENLNRFRETVQDAGWVDSWHVIQRDEIPLTIDLDQPETVGVDRLLATLAAHRLYGGPQDSKRDAIVVDCGTALTIDLVDKQATFRGGVIVAGPATSLLALNSMTSALPDLSREKLLQPNSVLGRSTRQAMLGGAWFSGLGAIKEVVAEMQSVTGGQPVVVGTGGGLGPWRDVLPAEWVLVNDLVLDGIFQVALELVQQ